MKLLYRVPLIAYGTLCLVFWAWTQFGDFSKYEHATATTLTGPDMVELLLFVFGGAIFTLCTLAGLFLWSFGASKVWKTSYLVGAAYIIGVVFLAHGFKVNMTSSVAWVMLGAMMLSASSGVYALLRGALPDRFPSRPLGLGYWSG